MRGAIMNLIWFFFFNDPATTEIYTLSLHDALPDLLDGGDGVQARPGHPAPGAEMVPGPLHPPELPGRDRPSVLPRRRQEQPDRRRRDARPRPGHLVPRRGRHRAH